MKEIESMQASNISTVRAKIEAEKAFLRSLPERPQFCCKECGSQNYRTIIRGLIPKAGQPFVQERVRICDPCSNKELERPDLTGQAERGILIRDR